MPGSVCVYSQTAQKKFTSYVRASLPCLVIICSGSLYDQNAKNALLPLPVASQQSLMLETESKDPMTECDLDLIAWHP